MVSRVAPIAKLEKTFTGTGQSDGVNLFGRFNVSLVGGVGTVKLEKSYDGGSTWVDDSMDGSGSVASWVLASGQEINVIGEEPEQGVLYRLNCTAYTSGNIVGRLSR